MAVLSNVCSDAVELDLTWVTQDPGRQLMTGSFHPVSGGDWGECHRWNRNHLPPPDNVRGSTGISIDPDFFKQGARRANDVDFKSSLKSLFSRRRFFYTYLLSVRARSIINTALFDTPNSFAAEAILPYLWADDIGRFSMSTKWETDLPFPGREVANLIRMQVEEGHQESVNPSLLTQLEQSSVAAVIAGQAQPVHNPVMDSVNRVFASVIKSSHIDPGVARELIGTVEQDSDAVFSADAKSLLVGIVDELLFQCSVAVKEFRSHGPTVVVLQKSSSSFIGRFFSQTRLPDRMAWHPKVSVKMSNLSKYYYQRGTYGTKRESLLVGPGDSVSIRKFDFSEHVLRAFFRQRAANETILREGAVYDTYSDSVASDGDMLVPGLGGVSEQDILKYTYMVEKILRQLFHVIVDNGITESQYTAVVVTPAHVMRAISSDRVLWSVFSQNVFPSTGLLPRGLRSDSLQRSRTMLSVGLRAACQWNQSQIRRVKSLEISHSQISGLIGEMQRALNMGNNVGQLHRLTMRLREMFRGLDHVAGRNYTQVAAILDWTKDVESRLNQDAKQVAQKVADQRPSFHSDKTARAETIQWGFHYISANHVHELAAALRVRLPKDAIALEPILSAVDEFILCTVNEAKAIAQVASPAGGGRDGGKVSLTLTHTLASLRLIMSADEASQMRPVGFSRVYGKARPILEIWMSREIGGALMAGRPAQSGVSVHANGHDDEQSARGAGQTQAVGESKVWQPQEGKVEREYVAGPAFKFDKDSDLAFSFVYHIIRCCYTRFNFNTF